MNPRVYKHGGRWHVRIAGLDFYSYDTWAEAFAVAFESSSAAHRMLGHGA